MKALIFLSLGSFGIIMNNNIISGFNMNRESEIWNISKNKVVNDTLKMQNYEPTLYWGANPSGEAPHRSVIRFFAKYAQNVPHSESFEILSLELSIGNQVFHILGDTMTEEVNELIWNTKSGEIIHCTAKVRGEDGVVRIVNGEWNLKYE